VHHREELRDALDLVDHDAAGGRPGLDQFAKALGLGGKGTEPFRIEQVDV
jgi:hypothetical protein